MSNRTHLLLLLFLSCTGFNAISQCQVAPTAPTFTGTEIQLASSQVISNGQTSWFQGTVPTAMGTVSLRGGTLVIDKGDLTINSLALDSGKLFVNAGATLTVIASPSGPLLLKGNIAIYNRGNLIIKNILSLEDGYASATKPILVINATANAQLTVQNNYFVINSPYAQFVNNGYASAHGLITEVKAAKGSVCLNNSITELSELHNKVANSYTTSGGTAACVSVRNRSYLDDTLTASPTINLALYTGHSTNSSKARPWGAAQVFQNATSCAAVFKVLPLQLFNVRLLSGKEALTLSWQTDAPATTTTLFYVERSTDGQHFIRVQTVAGTNSNQYQATEKVMNGYAYYRIAMVDVRSQQTAYSPVLLHKTAAAGFSVYPQPVGTRAWIQLETRNAAHVTFQLLDMSGREIKGSIQGYSNSSWHLVFPNGCVPGVYTLVATIDGMRYTQKLIKQ